MLLTHTQSHYFVTASHTLLLLYRCSSSLLVVCGMFLRSTMRYVLVSQQYTMTVVYLCRYSSCLNICYTDCYPDSTHISYLCIYLYTHTQIDVTPDEVMFASLIHNDAGNVTNCKGCTAGDLKCSGKHTYPGVNFGLHVEKSPPTSIKSGYFTTNRYIPFSLFPANMTASKIWRGNFYRYGTYSSHPFIALTSTPYIIYA